MLQQIEDVKICAVLNVADQIKRKFVVHFNFVALSCNYSYVFLYSLGRALCTALV